MTHDLTQTQTHTFATIGAAGAWNAAVALAARGPSWETVPSLILAAVAMLGAWNSYLNDSVNRQRMRSAPLPGPSPAPPTPPAGP